MNNDIKDLLEILLITYNRASNLDKTLEQLLAKESPVKNFEIKIIDNNSTDNTYEVVKRYQEKFPNLKYEKNKHNIGGNANVMKAFYTAEKKYVWVLCDNDYYCWDSWNDIKKGILADDDAIVVAKHEMPDYSYGQLYIQANFVPAIIYKTSLFDLNVMTNMAYNISNMFPHLAIAAKVINEQKKIRVVDKGIVIIGPNANSQTGEKYQYTRGLEKKELHPTLCNINWHVGYANSLLLIHDKTMRKAISHQNLFIYSPYNSAMLFYWNSKLKGSLYNLCSIFCMLSPADKLRFIINWVLYYTVYSILYFYTDCKICDKSDDEYMEKRYRVMIFHSFRLKLYKRKIKNTRYINEGGYISWRAWNKA